MQGHHTVATTGIGERVGKCIRTGCDVRVLVPIKAVACERRRIACIAVAHGQMQRHHAVATTGIGKRVGQRIRTGGDVRVFVPIETVTSKRCCVARITVTNRKMQRHHTVATRCIGEHVGK